jgi:hypothetical protein
MMQLLGYLLMNPFTSSAGLGLILANLGPVLTELGNGVPMATIFGDPHFSALMAAFAALSAKDMNVTGGKKANA